jgi:predicted dehydrogenase
MAIQVRIAIIGAGAVADYHHVPGIRLDPRAKLVAACDPNEQLLEKRKTDWSIAKVTREYAEIANDPQIDAVIICTPNDTHFPITLACLAGGKHVMCEKPLGLNAGEAWRMCRLAREKGLRHMTAFTYRFAPSMRYLRHLVTSGKLGVPRHFRSQRFLDWPETSWGWRQYKKNAGAGDLFDMTIHRIDYAQDLMGRMTSICGAVAQFVPRDKNPDGTSCPASEVDDWSALICQFERGGVGVLEGTTLAKGYHFDGFGHDWAEVNGSDASAVYQLKEPNTILIGKHGESLQKVDVPAEYLKPAGSPRDPKQGVPSTVFRYDLVWEFVSAIAEGRDAVPGFDHGASAQSVADAVLESFDKRTWVPLELSS